VHAELQIALADRDVTVVPLLLDGVSMPSSESLPEPIRPLRDLTAVDLSVTKIRDQMRPLLDQIAERINPLDGTGEGVMVRMAVREQLGSMLAGHVWALWTILLDHLDEPKWSFGAPSGFLEPDLRQLHRTTQWLVDIADRDVGWWRDVTILVSADATVWVVSDVVDRLTPPDTKEHSEFEGAMDSRHVRRRTVIERLVEAAKRQDSIAGAGSAAANETKDLVRCLYKCEVRPSYLVDLDAYTRRDDDVEIIGDRPFSYLREAVSWITDYLRPDRLEVDRVGEPVEPNTPPPASYRSSRLLHPQDDPATVWESRFSEGSWFRRVIERGRNEYPSGRLREASKSPGTG